MATGALYGAVAVLFVMLAGGGLVWAARPAQTPSLSRSDAIVLFAGGRRLAAAVELADREIAPRLIINLGNGKWPGYTSLLEHCTRDDVTHERICIVAHSDDTAGEAAAFAALARAAGHQRLTIVTDDYHLARAALRLSQCFDGDIQRVGTGDTGTFRQRLHELGGLVEALLLNRRCTEADFKLAAYPLLRAVPDHVSSDMSGSQ